MVEPVNDNILNLVNELYNNIDAKDKIINEQALEIARLKEDKNKAKEYIKSNYRVLLLTDPPREAFDINELLEVLGDKE